MGKKWNARGGVFSYFPGKKSRRSLLLVAFAFILMNIVFALPGYRAARADGPPLTIKPFSAVYSNKKPVTVQGTSFFANESVQIYWNYLGPGTGTLETTVMTNSKGAFSTSFYLPLATTGSYSIAAIGQMSGIVATGTFQLLPGLFVGPNPYTSGAKLHINGYAFGAGETVNLYWNYRGPGTGTLLTTVTGNASGSIIAYTLVPSGATAGTYTVAGVGQTSNAVATYAYVIPQFSPSLSISPVTSVYSVWNRITIQGKSFAAAETVNIYWNYSGPGTGTLEASPTTDAAGAFSVKINIPLAPTGTYTIAAIGQTSGFSLTGTFTLLPHIYGGPLDAGAGTPIHFNGYAFGAGETVNLYWNYTGPGTGTFLTTTTGNSTGSFLVYTTIPVGTHTGFITVAGVGQTTNAVATTPIFVYPPTVALAPLSGSDGTTLSISAYGFTAYEYASIYWNNATTPIATVRTNIYGYVPVTTFSVPPGLAPGAYPVTIVDATSNLTITNSFTIDSASSSASVTSGPVGQSVQVSGQGYAPGENVALIWNYAGPGTGTNVASVNAGLSGAFDATFTVPAASTGSYTIAAVGAASAIVTQNTFAITNGLAATAASASPGNTTTISGTGFQPGESVQLYWDSSTGTLLATTSADANGNIRQFVALPATATYGPHQLVGVGQASQSSFTTPITIDTAWADFGFDNAHDHQNAVENTLSAANVSDLKLKWTAATNINVSNSGCGAPGNVTSPLYANGTVYYATDDGYLNAYDAGSGALKWQFSSNTTFPVCSSPLFDPATNMVFFGTAGYDGSGVPSPFYALNASTGALEWSLILPWCEYGFPTLENNTLYVGMSREGYGEALYSIDERTGYVNWAHSTPGSVWGEVVTDPTINTVFTSVGNPTPGVEAINATTGALVWQYNAPTFGGDDDIGAPLTLANGLIYANSKNGFIYALNESTGAVVWSTQISALSNQDMSGPAVSINGTLYVGSNDGYLYALNASTGAVLWKFATTGPVYSSPAIANGVVYFASVDHNVYALDASSGSLLWTYSFGNQSYSSPIVVDGWVYCGASDGKLYAFSL